MTKSKKKKLLRAFTVSYELAYRRGVHHGFILAKRQPRLTEEKITTWRSSPVKKLCVTPWSHICYPIASRMASECREYSQTIQGFGTVPRKSQEI